ncbi:hypothetical protein BDN70DRAFT_881725 [Pholiota conissans]|uniref:Ubiquitin-like domain-containing protein n=1 Tax=Pholiota conissans TaxID=109636 RepID=A0A9P6CRE9_9AGAR|nr:hypothetical protein BDN70DRAFT_881725 [Pholiota conissans]
MAEQAERAFARTFLNTLSTQPIAYADDYQQAQEHSLKRVPVLPIAVPPPPKRKPQLEPSGSSSASISLTFKSLKPAATFTLRVEPTDTISAIKAQLAAQPSAPPADVQRLLLKGKALADTKLLREYTIKDGDTVNLMVKPGHQWDPTAPAPTQSTSTPDVTMAEHTTPPKSNPFGSGSLGEPSSSRPKGSKHQRIPSVVLSPSPSSDTPGAVEKDIVLTLDQDVPSPIGHSETLSTYHDIVADPGFWERLYTFLRQEFKTEADINIAFEDFLCATKGSLTPSEIAKIRDTVGVVGMGGT